MNFEGLLLVALFIGLPLLERLLERLRSGQRPPDQPPAPARQKRRKPAPARRPPAPVPARQAESVRETKVAEETEPLPAPMPAAARLPGHAYTSQAPAALAPVRPRRSRIPVSDLRRAVVLMTIFGPCKAMEPSGAPGAGPAGTPGGGRP